MKDNSHRPREATLKVIDRQKLAELIRRNFPKSEVEADDFWECGAYETVNKGLCVVNTEGVGTWENEDSRIAFYLWRGGWYEIDFDELPTVVTDKVVNLADFVAVHNDRLEDNFDLWYGRRIQ